LEKIGEGGMDQVYLAEDTSLERKVALKFLPLGLQTNPVAHKRFIREAKSAAAIDHPFRSVWRLLRYWKKLRSKDQNAKVVLVLSVERTEDVG
jgi:serine/threonine protein kinase